MELTGVSKKDAPLVFHESEYQDRKKIMDPRQDLKTIRDQEESAQAKTDIENVNSKAHGLQIPEIDRAGYLSPKEVLAGLQIDALEKELTPGDLAMKTVKEVVENIKMKMKAVFSSATEFNYSVRKNFDGTVLADLPCGRTRQSNTELQNPKPPWFADRPEHHKHALQSVAHPCFHGH